MLAPAFEVDIGECVTWAGMGIQMLGDNLPKPKPRIHLLPNWFESESKTRL